MINDIDRIENFVGLASLIERNPVQIVLARLDKING